MLHKLISRSFIQIADRTLPFTTIGACLILAVGSIIALFFSPADYQQGESVRIMYVHVPSAWMSLFIYAFMAFASIIYLTWRNPLWDSLAQSAAPIGAAFTLITLITGSLWGKPIWGTWWVWDARLTSVLILFFLYIGYIALSHAFDNPERGAKSSAILAIVGVINIPIIKFSVEWWNTLHQPASVVKLDGPAIHISMLIPLLLMFGGFMLLFTSLLLARTKSTIIRKRIHRLRMGNLHRTI